jgi:glycogen operon protein
MNSINLVTCHDGFTLYDLVSYRAKRNEANGEDSRDGTLENLSWNCGVEGETEDPAVLELRRRQCKNFLAVLLVSQGVPMLLAGDEVLRSQKGNNNAYCQDNELSWLDWTLTERTRDMLRFTREMVRFRRRHPCLMRRRFLSGERAAQTRLPDVTWHGRELYAPPWADPGARVMAFTLAAMSAEEEDLHVVLNMSEEPLHAPVPLPPAPGFAWFRAVDTAQPAPADVQVPGEQQRLGSERYPVAPRSVVVFEARSAP